MRSRNLIFVLGIALGVPLLFALLFEKVAPHQIGVKLLRFGAEGVVKQDHTAGFHVGITGIHRWLFLPRRSHFIHYTQERGVSSETTMWKPAVQIRTKDNNETMIEVSVLYQIREGQGHQIVMRGWRQGYPDRVHTIVEGVLRSQLAELTSEDLQDTATRLRRIDETLPLLNQQLAEFHVETEAILIRKVTFQAEYEAQLQEKQYLTQKANLDRALALVANEEKVTNSIEKQIVAAEAKLTADWDKLFQEETSRYEVLVAEIGAQAKVYESRAKAEGDAEQVRLRAEGQLALDQARALRDRLRNEALNSSGGRVYLALQAAGNLRLTSVTLNSNDPRVPMVLDLDALTDLLMGAPAP